MDISVRKEIKNLLINKDYANLVELCEEDSDHWKCLRQSLYEPDENLRWAAIEATARLMQSRWQAGQEEKVRDYIRRLIWSLTDESGEMGWSAPETIAMTISLIPELLEPYGSMMLVRALEEPPLVNGALWGIGRLGKTIRGQVEILKELALETFQSGDPQTLGVAAWAMGEAGLPAALPYIKKLVNRSELARVYIEGRLHEKSLGQWAEEAIGKIGISFDT